MHKDFAQTAQQRRYIDRFGPQVTASAEREQTARNRRSALDRLDRKASESSNASLIARAPLDQCGRPPTA